MAAVRTERTCWQGLMIEHPAQWELSATSGGPELGHLNFSDRRYTRLELSWRKLKYVPKLDLMIQKYRQSKGGRSGEVSFSPLEGAGADWQGIVRTFEGGIAVHAARFFRPQKLLAEVTILWPGKRSKALERAILNSVAAEPPGQKLRHWRAMGVDVQVPVELELTSQEPLVGRIRWTFSIPRQKKRSPQVIVERLALTEHWLQGSLEEWLVAQLPPQSRVREKNAITFNAHEAQRLLSETRIGTIAGLRGLRRMRLDIAWRCPVDGRVYHLACTEVRRDGTPQLPQGLYVDCCVPTPAVTESAEL